MPTSRPGSSSCSAPWAIAPTTRRSRRALDYLWRTQEPEGCWYGRWGVNYIYGTWQVLQGLKAHRLPDGSSGDRCKAVALARIDPAALGRLGRDLPELRRPVAQGDRRADASQTAWAMLGLIAAGRASSPAVRRGIDYLIETQLPDGSWDEPQFTGTGFPRVFYLRYHYYRVYFPLMAIARYQAAIDSAARPDRARPWRAGSRPSRCRWTSENAG